jgi:hypothetical protein
LYTISEGRQTVQNDFREADHSGLFGSGLDNLVGDGGVEARLAPEIEGKPVIGHANAKSPSYRPPSFSGITDRPSAAFF